MYNTIDNRRFRYELFSFLKLIKNERLIETNINYNKDI